MDSGKSLFLSDFESFIVAIHCLIAFGSLRLFLLVLFETKLLMNICSEDEARN